MPKDRDQLTPEEPEDAAHLASHRGQGTAGTGQDLLGNGPRRAGSAAIEANEHLPHTDDEEDRA
jgi:hypothetical protein